MMTGAVLLRPGRDLAGFGDYGLITTAHNEWRLISNLMQAGDRVIVLSESGRRAFHKRGFRYDKMHVVRHGILQSPRRRAEVHAREARPPGRKPPVTITVAGLYRRKGVGDLISAFGDIANEFPDATLQILGSGPDREYFETLKAQTNGSDRIHFQGFIAKPDRALREASVFVLASRTEAFPLAVAEAREAGCAVIATAVGGIPELLDHGRAGILIPPHNPALLAQELRRVLRDPAKLERWRRAARTNLDWLSCKRMASETINVYRSLPQPSWRVVCLPTPDRQPSGRRSEARAEHVGSDHGANSSLDRASCAPSAPRRRDAAARRFRSRRQTATSAIRWPTRR